MTSFIIPIFPVLSGIVLGYGVLWMKRPFFQLALKSVGLLDLLVADMDEDEKFERVNTATFGTLKSLGIVLGQFVLVLLATFFVYTYLPSMLWVDLMASSEKLLLMALGSIVPFLLPKWKKNHSAYSEMAQLFHRLVLNHYHLGRRLLSRQIKGVTHPVSTTTAQPSAVLITGLARAGTTALTRELAKSGPFSSLDYSNMPLLLAPRLWSKIYKPKRTENQERAHGDGIKVGLASVEALEEYFFKVITNDRYISDEGLLPHELTREENDLYRRYFKSLTPEGNLYLAKNNNAILRLPSLHALNPDISMYVLVREPLQHAASLLAQHLKFEQQQDDDPFVLEYMNWLGHHEFGKGQKPFLLSETPSFEQFSTHSLNYWLILWIRYYERILSTSFVTVVPYEDFLKEPANVLRSIGSDLGLEVKLESLTVFEKHPAVLPEYHQELADKAKELYHTLINHREKSITN